MGMEGGTVFIRGDLMAGENLWNRTTTTSGAHSTSSIAPLRNLRQQKPNTIDIVRIVPLERTYCFDADGARLLEVDQGTIEVQPVPKILFPNNSPDLWVDESRNGCRGGSRVDRDPSKVSMFVSDGLERRGGPFNPPRSKPKHHVPELCCLR